MNFEAAGGWAQHLTNPFALAGFVILAFSGIALILGKLPSARLKSAETQGLFRLVIVGGLVLGALAIVLSFTAPLMQPKTQQVSNIKGSDVAVGGNQAAVIEKGQAVNMHKGEKDCQNTSQTVNGVENSRLTVAGCEGSTTARE